MSVLIKAWEHFKTITRHRHGVIKNCYKAGILWQGLRHDLSKYSPEEFLKGCKYYQGTRSPHEAEREEYGFSYGWMHHKGRNKHHFEYWTDYDLRTKLMTPVKMPLKYVKEMFCDRVAASIQRMMVDYRANPPKEILGSLVVKINEIQTLEAFDVRTGKKTHLEQDKSNVLQWYTEDGTRVCVRPSGTEPKIKFYFGVKATLPSVADYEKVRAELNDKIERIKKELKLV